MEILINLMLIFSFAFSLLFKLMNYLAFYRLYKASGNMSGSSLDIIKQIKRRFSDCFTLGKPIENTESYIRRILLSSDKYSTATSLRDKISTCFLLIFWGILWLGYVKGALSYENTVLYAVISIIILYTADRIFDTGDMERGFITYATDYLDNTIKCRLQKAGSKNAAVNPVRSFGTTLEADNSTVIKDFNVQNGKQDTLSDKSSFEMAAADDTELITSIIDEFIL